MSNFLDNMVERFRALKDPNYHIRQAQVAMMNFYIEEEKKRSAFKAAESNRLTANWTATGESINSFLQRELTTMRNRSRWLLRNTSTAISAMNAFVSYCIGSGIRPISTVYDKIKRRDDEGNWYLEQKENDVWNETTDDLWDSWARDVDVTASKNSPDSFYITQELVLRKWVEDGEAFVHVVVDKSNTVVPLYVEFFEPESLDLNRTEGNNGNKVVLGIELDKDTSRPVGYWINQNSTSKRYDATEIFHIFKRMRPGQVRGYPLMHGVTQNFFQLQEYEDAELLGCKIAACLAVFIERARGTTPGGDFIPGNSSAQAVDGDGNPLTHIQPGMVGSIPNGAGLHVVQPQKPGATFGMFTEHIDRKTGAGIEYGLSYEALSRNTSKASYAGGRLATQRDYQAFRQIIAFMNGKFNQPFRNYWMDIAVLHAAIDAPGYYSLSANVRHDRTYWQRHEWIPPAWQYGVNPKDDIAAARDAMRAGISTLDQECGFVGRDWRTVLRLKSRIKKTADRLGLTLTSDGAVSIANGIDMSQDENGDGSDEDSEKASKQTANAGAE
jgi:lambda family phage portal protein